ncbi:MAG: hypothetical protein WD398_07160 [Cyclobacteriaceae bacterium]
MISCQGGKRINQSVKGMISSVTKAQIQSCLDSLEILEPKDYELGTPQLEESSEYIEKIISYGPSAISYLMDLSSNATPKKTAYIVFILGKLDGRGLTEQIIKIRTEFENKTSKSDWDYAVIGQCNIILKKPGD